MNYIIKKLLKWCGFKCTDRVNVDTDSENKTTKETPLNNSVKPGSPQDIWLKSIKGNNDGEN